MGNQRCWLAFVAVLPLLASLALEQAAAAGVLRSHGAPLTSGVVDSLEAGTAAAKIAGLKAKAAASVSRARAAAAQAGTSAVHVEQLKVQNEMKKPELAEALAVAKDAATSAVEAVKEANAALTEVKGLAKTAVENAKRLAIEDVKAAMTAKYHQLDEWRNKVLDDPYTRARKAGEKAVEPYNKMIKAYYKRIGQYQKTAKGMMGKANSMAAAAQGLAGGAQGTLNGGDAITANQNMMTANAMRKTANGLAGSAQALQGEATAMNNWIGQYIADAHMAAWTAEYNSDPDDIPPPPVNPNYAFTPPPPSGSY